MDHIASVIPLLNGIRIPAFGRSVLAGEAVINVNSVRFALEDGYRYIDMAKVYGNEAELAHAIVASRTARAGALSLNAEGFSLHAKVRCAMNQRNKLERLCLYITRPAIANERLKRNSAGDIMLQLKSPYRYGTTHIVMSPLDKIAGSGVTGMVVSQLVEVQPSPCEKGRSRRKQGCPKKF